ncbi:MAG: DUF2231 domain-containing protein [Candidatus Paceibacterota bacterium]
MNIHPLFVHFPIGLLVAYSVLELGAYLFPALRRQAWLFPVNAFLLFVGILAAFATLVTGDMAEELIETAGDPNGALVETHSSFAATTTLLYLVLAAAYLNRIFDRKGWFTLVIGTNRFLAWGWNVKKYLAHLILDTWLLPVLALIALIGMTITGGLGAAIVYGPNVDPLVSFIYQLFF